MHRGASWATSPWRVVVCGWCQRTYKTQRSTGRFCSNACANASNGIMQRFSCDISPVQCDVCDAWRVRSSAPCPALAKHPPPTKPDIETLMAPRPCDECGTQFTPRTPAGWFARFCSSSCRQRSGNRRHRVARSKFNKKFRSTRNIGRVRRWAIYERDGWMCQLCGRRVDRRFHAPHRMAPSLDHIIPVSAGGPDTEANLQLAHFGCNSAKGDRITVMGSQLRLL